MRSRKNDNRGMGVNGKEAKSDQMNRERKETNKEIKHNESLHKVPP
jgi:hypothetical protein